MMPGPTLTPRLDVIFHRPEVRGPKGTSQRGRVFRRYADGTLDYESAMHAILDALWKVRAGGALTPIEQALVGIVVPADVPPGAHVRLGRISAEERRALLTLVLRRLLEIAVAERAQILARSAADWTLDDFRACVPIVLAGDPFRLGTARIAKALAAERPQGGGVLAGPRGGVFHFSPTGHKIYERRASRASDEAHRSGSPEHHAEAAVLWLKEAWLREQHGDRAGALEALRVARTHHAAAAESGLRTQTMDWLAMRLDKMGQRLPGSPQAGPAASPAAR